MKYITVKITLSLLLCLLTIFSSGIMASGFVLNDPKIPDGEKFVWRVTKPDIEPVFSTITWNVGNRNGKPVYEITLNSVNRKQAKYILDKSNMQLVWLHSVEETKDGRFELIIEVRNNRQYLTYKIDGKTKDKDIEQGSDGYDGTVIPFWLRGFPFGKKSEVKLKITPPLHPGRSLWAWKMWDSYVKLLGEERITVPAGTFDCYKLEVAASGGIIRRLTPTSYFWYTKEAPYRFVKFQDDEEKYATELVEIKSKGK